MDHRGCGHGAPALGAVPQVQGGHPRLTAGRAEVGRWVVERVEGRAEAVLNRAWPSPAVPTVTLVRMAGRAVVLGSTQSDAVVDAGRAEAAGVEVVRRRSGGGAVLAEPETLCWVDVFVPADDALWRDDVARAFHWLGTAWADTLTALDVDADVHVGAVRADRWSSLVCFAGLGPGEVTSSGRKVVGLCQRRTRVGALFQCGVLAAWDPAPLVDVLQLEPDVRLEATNALAPAAVGSGVPVSMLEEGFLRSVESW